jgi:ABC-type microcin C transport system duplicated ATPase subunit YejF
MSAAERRSISGRLQVVFQDPYSSLNPSRRVGQIISEPLGVHIPKASRGNSTRPGARLTGPLRSAP